MGQQPEVVKMLVGDQNAQQVRIVAIQSSNAIWNMAAVIAFGIKR